MRVFIAALVLIFSFQSWTKAETYSCIYEFNNKTNLKVMKRQKNIFIDDDGTKAGEVIFENDESIILMDYFSLMSEDFPAVAFLTHIDKRQKAFIMTGLKYPKPTATIFGKCKVTD